jgi:hypothetical protein
MKTTEKIRGRKCGLRDITLDWPDPPIAFQPIDFNWQPAFPVLLFPWGCGRQLIYSVDDQQTFFEKIPPLWWLYPNTPAHLNGEEYRPDMGRIRYSYWFIKNQLGGDHLLEAGSWLVNDYYDPALDANTRASKLVNLGAQPAGVVVARPVQVNSVETFNKYLLQMHDDGFLGALIRPLDHLYGQTQYAALRPLE